MSAPLILSGLATSVIKWVKDIFFVCCTWLLVQHQHFHKISFQWQAQHVFHSCHILYITFLKVAKRYKSVLEGYVRLENYLSWNLCKTLSLKTYSTFYTHPLRLKILIYSWNPLFRSPKGNGKKFETAGFQNNWGSVKFITLNHFLIKYSTVWRNRKTLIE